MQQCNSFRIYEWSYDINDISIFDFSGLSLKRGFGGCGHGFSGCDGLGGLGGFGGFNGFDGLGGFDGFSGFNGFDGQPRLSLNGFSVSFTLPLKIFYLVIDYPLSYTCLNDEPQLSRKERFIPRYLHYGVIDDLMIVYFSFQC